MPSDTKSERAKNRKINKLRNEGKPKKQAIAQAIKTVSKRMRKR